MNQCKNTFSPDSRNLGGRKLILFQMLNHKTSLEKTRSTFSQSTIPHSPIGKYKFYLFSFLQVRRTPSPLYKLYDQFSNVLQTFKRVNLINKSQRKLPSDQKKQNQQHKDTSQNKKSLYDLDLHMKNMQNCMKRIDAIGTVQERRKNKQDYLVYPSFFFRRLDKPQMKQLINKSTPLQEATNLFQLQNKKVINMSGETKMKPPTKEQTGVKIKNKTNQLPTQDKKVVLKQLLQPQRFKQSQQSNRINKQMTIVPPTQKQKQRQKNKNNTQSDIDWNRLAQQIPKYDAGMEERFKSEILKIIVEHRIYSDDDYAFLVCMISSVNLNVDQQKILTLFQQILNPQQEI